LEENTYNKNEQIKFQTQFNEINEKYNYLINQENKKDVSITTNDKIIILKPGYEDFVENNENENMLNVYLDTQQNYLNLINSKNIKIK